MIGLALLAQAVATVQPAPVVGELAETTWPQSYRCRVVTDAAQAIEFSMQVSGLEVVLGRDVIGFESGQPIQMRKSGVGPKHDGEYWRMLSLDDGRKQSLYISQSGRPTDPSTSVSFDAGGSELPYAKRRPRASGFCLVEGSDSEQRAFR